ncbi:hypothetical protein [Leuconostoc falkenbergense]|uniref:hypothetical protein n=1 Tax=Leuconostoc falkenbergense TaxID=2766470 RepID=UPI0039E884F8
MIETVVHVTTLEQWKSVLGVWFKQGYTWQARDTVYAKFIFDNGARYLHLDRYISYSISAPKEFIEYSEFMAQQKEDKKMATYYVTQEQFDLIIFLKHKKAPLDWLIMDYDNAYRALRVDITVEKSNSILRYLGGDETIEFKVKEPLYRLWRIDDVDDRVYMRFTSSGNPDWTMGKDVAFTATLEEIKKWQTPAWDIEKAD